MTNVINVKNFKFGDAIVDSVGAEETAYVTYCRDVFVGDENIGKLFWTVAADVELTHYYNDPGYWGPTMAESEPGGLEVEYNLSDTWIVDDETYNDIADEKLDKELTDLIPELIENDVMFCEITSLAEGDIYDVYCDYIVDVMENNRNSKYDYYDNWEPGDDEDPNEDYNYDIYD